RVFAAKAFEYATPARVHAGIDLRARGFDLATATGKSAVFDQAVAAMAELFAQVLAHQRNVVRVQADLGMSLGQLL
ncbi:hypothetical protein Q6294_34820, partial [Klebsiella pneumoniae]